MNERDELAKVIAAADGSGHFLRNGRRYAYGPVADAILAAGYRKPRTITTVEELDAAIIKSFEQGETLVLMDAWRPWIIWEDDYGDAHVSSLRMEDDPERLTLADVPFPVTVIYEPLP